MYSTKSNVESSLNSAGLKPDDTKKLPERNATPSEEPVLMAIREMYSCKPTSTTFDIYNRNAIFHDPIGIANGLDSIKSQFLGLAKIFDHAEIQKFRLLENPPTVPPGTILIDQDVVYYRKPKATSPFKVVNSLLTIKMDNNKITSHNEEWDHNKSTTREDGFLGFLNEERKKFTAGLTDMFVGGKD